MFAPTDDAFAKIPKKDLNALLADKETLTAVLTHHVVGEQLAPRTSRASTRPWTATWSPSRARARTSPSTGAAVVCGNVQTANATVYVVDRPDAEM